MRVDVAIVGAGPAGLAGAIAIARRGLSTVVLERREIPTDKACGEGLMPSGVRSLERLGARRFLDSAECSRIVGIRYVQEDGTRAEALLKGEGLGIRRTALVGALARRARELGVGLRERCAVRRHRRLPDCIALTTDVDEVRAKLLVAADGLASPTRRAEGLDRPVQGARRFGLRQHFRRAPWTGFVEVHLAAELEAYVTPCGPERVNVAFLWEDGRVAGPISFSAMLRRFPALRERLAGATADSLPLGAGPLRRSSWARVADRLVLVGDAAGYVDAITGEGLSLSFECAAALGQIVPEASAQDFRREALLPYERVFGRAFSHYARVTQSVLALARNPPLRRHAVHWLSAHPRTFERLVNWAI